MVNKFDQPYEKLVNAFTEINKDVDTARVTPLVSRDPAKKGKLYKQFDELRREKTTIFVSHRLSSTTSADKIVVLDGGRLVEQGKHAELMAKGGRYYELFTTQAKHYMESERFVEE